jgi:hypothetical protein
VLDRSVAALSTVVRTVTLPTLLEAATVQGAGCMGITIEYAFASLGVAVAWAALLELWYLPAAWSAMGVAIGAWDKALGSLLDCMV